MKNDDAEMLTLLRKQEARISDRSKRGDKARKLGKIVASSAIAPVIMLLTVAPPDGSPWPSGSGTALIIAIGLAVVGLSIWYGAQLYEA